MDLHRIGHEAARLLPLAHSVLERYSFRVREVTHLATHSNVMYRVVTSDGYQCVLRVGSPHSNSRTNIEYEVAWLSALNRDTEIEVVAPIATGYGTLIVDAQEPDSDKVRSCVLFSWVPGAPLADGAGSFGYRLLGRMSASLQQHGRTWQPPNPEGMRRWDRVFYYDANHDPVIIHDPRFDHLFDIHRRRTMHQAIEISEKVIEDAWKSEFPHVVHGDLHEWNVHLSRSRLHAFDFEDVMIATPGQDVSVCLYSSRTSPRRSEIRAAFRQGFEEIAAWPIVDDEQLDGFHAARQVLLMNYAARTLPMGEAEDYLAQVTPWLRRYVDHYG
ncbi:MAG: phosphotransferase enzyme family protein [Acidimicrobiia bacterium]